MLDRSVLKWGGLSAMVGAALGLVFNLLHPRPDSFTIQAELDLVAGSDIWLFDHFMLAWSLAFALVGLVAIGWSFEGPVAQSWGRIATASAIGSIAVAYIALAIDGMAMKEVADQAAKGPEAQAAAEAVAHVSFALFTGVIGSLFGVTPLLFGIAGLVGNAYPRNLAYLALAGGLVGLLAASIQYLSGPTALTLNVLLLIASLAYTVWLFMMGLRLWKSGGAPATAAPASLTT